MSDRLTGGSEEGRRPPERVLVAIAGRQHADQLTAALIEAGMDAVLCHTRPVRRGLLDILASRTLWRPFLGIVESLAVRIMPESLALRVAYFTYYRFDRAAAQLVQKLRPSAVIGYENGTLETFRAAKRFGITTVLDAASVHHSLQTEAGLAESRTHFRRKINARKDAEIALADHVLTCSTLARESYIEAGVPPSRVHVVPLGYDGNIFMPATGGRREGPVRFAFVGRFTRAKGAEILADALDSLRTHNHRFRLKVAADPINSEQGLRERLGQHGQLMGKIRHEDLVQLYHWADALILPSQFDSFGLVVLEALACGLPVIVSDRVGAKDFVTHGVNGFVLLWNRPLEWAAALEGLARDPEPLRAMRNAAQAAARGAVWPRYREQASVTVRDLIRRSTEDL